MALTKVTYSMIEGAPFNVTDYGATGNGTDNDTTAFAAAIAAASGQSLYLPSGTYLLSGSTITIPDNINIIGEPGSIVKLETTASSKYLFNIESSVDNMMIQGVTFDLNQLTSESHTNIAVQISGSSNVNINNCRIINSASSAFGANNRGYGIYLAGAYESINVSECYFERHMYSVITEPTSTGKAITVTSSTFFELAGDGVEINVPTSGSCENIVVNKCFFNYLGSNNLGRGFGVGASGGSTGSVKNLYITNNSFYNIDNQGVHIEDGVVGFWIESNEFNACGTAAAATFGSSVYVAKGTSGTNLGEGWIINNDAKAASGSNYVYFIAGTYDVESLFVKNNFGDAKGFAANVYQINSANSRVVCSNNIAKNANGVGMVLNFTKGIVSDNICWDDQAVKTQTYGISLADDMNTVIIKDNILDGNINLGYSSPSTFPVAVQNGIHRSSELTVSGSAYSNWINICNLGESASGAILFKGRIGTNYAAAIYNFVWDGTSLTGTYVGKNTNGTLDVSATTANAIQMSGNVIQVRVYNSGSTSSALSIEGVVNGLIMFK